MDFKKKMWAFWKICLCLLATLNIVHGQSTRNVCENQEDHTLVPSDVSCALYFECINDVAYLLSCPRGLFFSELRQSCDLPSNVECDLMSSTTPGPTSPGPIVSCENVTNFQYIPSPVSCSEYYQCIDGVAYLLSCPRGLHFSDLNQTCDSPANANCPLVSPTPPGTTSPTPTTPGPTVSCRNVENFRFIASPTSCSLYYQCIEDVPFLVSCPRGLYFSEQIQTCDYSSNVNCDIFSTPRPSPPTPNCQNIPDNIFLPSQNSCSLYYQCIGNVPYLVSCPRGLYFNEQIQTCDYPSNVDCVSTIVGPTTPVIPTAPTVGMHNLSV